MTDLPDEHYSSPDYSQRKQGDIYPSSKFDSRSLPPAEIANWMLLNRSCQLFINEKRKCKLNSLNYAGIHTLTDFLEINSSQENNRNKIKNLIHYKYDGFVLLPTWKEMGIEHELVVNFNLIISVSEDKCPKASEKILELTSPFSEHVFQKFSRFFYTVGYNDERIKSDEYIDTLLGKMQA
ncbi:hypothetical protein SCR50_04595 [Legionella pneumophila serogroup 1]